jgi:hypothetical protein
LGPRYQVFVNNIDNIDKLMDDKGDCGFSNYEKLIASQKICALS